MVTADAHFFDAVFPGLFKGQAEHLNGVAVLTFCRADAVADVPP